MPAQSDVFRLVRLPCRGWHPRRPAEKRKPGREWYSLPGSAAHMSGVFAELELRIIRERVRSGMRNARAKGIAALRCRWQIQQGRNFRSGRKTRGAAQVRSVFRVPQGGSADRRPRLTIFPLTSFGIIRNIRRERSISQN